MLIKLTLRINSDQESKGQSPCISFPTINNSYLGWSKNIKQKRENCHKFCKAVATIKMNFNV